MNVNELLDTIEDLLEESTGMVSWIAPATSTLF